MCTRNTGFDEHKLTSFDHRLALLAQIWLLVVSLRKELPEKFYTVHMYSCMAIRIWWTSINRLPLNGQSCVRNLSISFCKFSSISAKLWGNLEMQFKCAQIIGKRVCSLKRAENCIKTDAQTLTLYVVERWHVLARHVC